MDGKEIGISEAEYQTIKAASNAGKSIVWFDTFTISIPHMSRMVKVEKPKFKPLQLPEGDVKDRHEEIQKLKRELLRKKIIKNL
jgi:hypothetical protein